MSDPRVMPTHTGSLWGTAHLFDGPLDGQTMPCEFPTKWLRLPEEQPGGFYMFDGYVTENTDRDYIYRWEEERR